ncbi:MAG: FAD-dependent monooxygenase [Cohaesibacteraceae bacterium]|nr:FAD-dependent monooxygenase [Cohaesibacteraceae bacterium]
MTSCSEKNVFDCIVVGGGPAGLIASLECASRDLTVCLIALEMNEPDGRTTALMQGSIAYLDTLDLSDEIKASAAPLVTMRLIDDTGRLFRAPETTFHASELELPAFGYNLSNVELNSILKRRVSDCKNICWIKSKVTNVTTEGLHAIANTQDQCYKASLLIGADGRKSMIRETAGIGIKNWDYPQAAMVVNLSHTIAHNNISTEFHTKTGPFTLVPLAKNKSSLVCVVTREQAGPLSELSEENLCNELERRSHHILGKFSLISKPAIFPLSGFVANKNFGQRTALVGESAHAFPPIGAQGLNLSLRDIQNLGALLEKAMMSGKDVGSPEVLQEYHTDRRTDIWTRTAGVHLLNLSLISDFPLLQPGRATGLYLSSKITFLRKHLMRAGLNIPLARR